MNSQAASQLRKAANIDIHVAARPAAIDLPLSRTALVVVDMQNGYGSPGGYREIIGRNISGVEQVVDNTVRVIAAARAAGVTRRLPAKRLGCGIEDDWWPGFTQLA